MEWIIFPILIAVVLFWKAVASVGEKRFTVPTLLRKRMKKYWTEGLHLLIPFFMSVKEKYTYSLEPQTMEISFSFFSKDRRELKVSWLIRWAADPKVKTKEGHIRFAEVMLDTSANRLETLENGLKSKLMSEVGRLGGMHPWEVFINMRRAIEHYINSILRLEEPPHINPAKVLKEQLANIPEYQHLQGNALNDEVPFEKRLEFYKEFSGPIGELLRIESSTDEHSLDEEFYGINLLELSIDNVDFSQATKEALEQEARARDQIAAAMQFHRAKVEMAGDYTDEKDGGLGLNSRSAVESAELNLGQAVEKKVHSVHGLEGLHNIIGR